MVIFDTALHVLQLIQDSKHVNELPQREEIGLGDKVLPPLSVAQALHLTAEPLDSLALEGNRTGSSQLCHPMVVASPLGPPSPTHHLLPLTNAFFCWGWRPHHEPKLLNKSLHANICSAGGEKVAGTLYLCPP